ncbi:MAG: YpmA family protein [Peptococcaceae bacterium]|nr:YpmA family protein [Peptococcaceae bacterium]
MKEDREKNDQGKLELIAFKSFPPYNEMYRVVDFLNKSLKDRKLMFGLTKDRENGTMTITIYEV